MVRYKNGKGLIGPFHSKMNKNTVFLTAINIINYFSAFSTLRKIKYCNKKIIKLDKRLIELILKFYYSLYIREAEV